MSIQTSYSINPGRGFPGDIARPSEPHAIDSGAIHVPVGAARKPRPGDPVYYDRANDGFAIPTTAALLQTVLGVLTYRHDTVQSGSERDTIEFSDGDEVEVVRFGTVWVVAGSALEYGQRIDWDTGDYMWDAQADPASLAIANLAGTFNLALVNGLKNSVVAAITAGLRSLNSVPIVCVSRSAVAVNGVAEASIGYGRVF